MLDSQITLKHFFPHSYSVQRLSRTAGQNQ
jgi:hypothetical protein